MRVRIGQNGASRLRCRGAGAFSLVELMIALGVMGVGLVLIASVFPAAMMKNKESISDTMATIIAENAVAVCRARLSHSRMLTELDQATQHQFQDISRLIPLADRAYPSPIGRRDDPGGWQQIGSLWYEMEPGEEEWMDIQGHWYPASRYGWLVAARRVLTGWQSGDPLPNDYQLVIVPYRKLDRQHRPTSDGIQPAEICFAGVSVASDVITAGDFGEGGPVIYRGAANPDPFEPGVSFAHVIRKSATEATLSLSGFPNGEALTVIERLPGVMVLPDSPAIGCYVVRMSLRP